MKMYNKYDFVFNLNLKFLQVFFMLVSLFRICDTIFTTPGSLSDEKYKDE